jgi:hypothetical protein
MKQYNMPHMPASTGMTSTQFTTLESFGINYPEGPV